MEENKEAEEKSKKLPAYMVAIAINILSFSSGVAYAWTSPAIPRMNGSVDPENNPLSQNLTPGEESWIASLLSLGSAAGPFVFGYMSDKIGRKLTLIWGAIPLGISFVMKAFGSEVYHFYIARLVGGFGTGAGFTIIPMYIGEIAEDYNRGTLGCFMPLMVTSGFLFVFCLGPYVTIKTCSLINAVPPFIFVVILLCYVPESPYYLVAKNKLQDAEKSLCFLRGVKDKGSVYDEMLIVKRNVQESFANKGSVLDIFKTKGLRLAIIITTSMMLFQQISGVTAILSYMQSIFTAAGSSLPPDISVIFIGFVQLFSCALAPIVVDKLGRRILYFLSTISSCFSQFAMGLYFYLKENDYNLEHLSWLPIASLIIFVCAYNLGLGTLAWVLVGELFPPKMRAVASTLSTFVCLIIAFAVTVIFPYIVLYIGMAQSFWMFSLCCAGAFIFVYILLPETKGKSLRDIQILLNNGKVRHCSASKDGCKRRLDL